MLTEGRVKTTAQQFEQHVDKQTVTTTLSPQELIHLQLHDWLVGEGGGGGVVDLVRVTFTLPLIQRHDSLAAAYE